MAEKHLRDTPQRPRVMTEKNACEDSMWWYEESDGIAILCDPSQSVTSAHIPLKALRAYLERLDKP